MSDLSKTISLPAVAPSKVTSPVKVPPAKGITPDNLLTSIAAEPFTSAFTITPLAIENAPVFDISISPEGFTDVATPDPLPTNIFPSANVANLL